MNVLVTGNSGFLGQHVSAKLKRLGVQVLGFDRGDDPSSLEGLLLSADYIVHLAGVNRPENPDEFYEVNVGLTKQIIEILEKNHRKTPLVFASSIQAELDNDYGKSKREAEQALWDSGVPSYVYRFANIFGRGGRPNYNSVVATFCYNLAHGVPLMISDPDKVVNFQYVDDVVDALLSPMYMDACGTKEILSLKKTHPCTLGHLVELLVSFKEAVESPQHLPLLHDEFELSLFKTLCFYLSDEGSSFNYAADERGYFEELYKSKQWGQISENMAHPGITKGGHYHKRKKEKFLTVIGHCLITQGEQEDDVTGEQPRIVDIQVGKTHYIQNKGFTDSKTLMWISEVYDEESADTYRE